MKTKFWDEILGLMDHNFSPEGVYWIFLCVVGGRKLFHSPAVEQVLEGSQIPAVHILDVW